MNVLFARCLSPLRSSVSYGLLALASMAAPARGAAAAEGRWEQIAPLFHPPAEFANGFGDFKSPLKFYDGRPVITKTDWQQRRQEILAAWHKIMGPWPPLIQKPKIEYLEKNRRRELYPTSRPGGDCPKPDDRRLPARARWPRPVPSGGGALL